LAAAYYAAEIGAELLVCHHPLIWDPFKTVTTETHGGRTAIMLIKNNIAFAAAHTNWDSAQGGINDVLAGLLHLQDLKPFGYAASVSNLKLVVFVPASGVDGVIDAASAAGAGVIGLYRRCAFSSEGVGTFLAEEGANPVVGKKGQVEKVDEVRVEMVLPSGLKAKVASAVSNAHPYEEPAFDFYQLADTEEQPAGRIGRLATPVSLRQFVANVDAALATVSLAWGDPDRLISQVAVCGGAADEEWVSAQASGADAFVSGEIRQHIGLEASESGFAVVAAGHYATEHPGSAALCEALKLRVTDVEWNVFEPLPGFAGRPFTG
jgi:dinuclear metal center YbgI/SA1388 family protein